MNKLTWWFFIQQEPVS